MNGGKTNQDVYDGVSYSAKQSQKYTSIFKLVKVSFEII